LSKICFLDFSLELRSESNIISIKNSLGVIWQFIIFHSHIFIEGEMIGKMWSRDMGVDLKGFWTILIISIVEMDVHFICLTASFPCSSMLNDYVYKSMYCHEISTIMLILGLNFCSVLSRCLWKIDNWEWPKHISDYDLWLWISIFLQKVTFNFLFLNCLNI